jgi:hypothetical protein
MLEPKPTGDLAPSILSERHTMEIPSTIPVFFRCKGEDDRGPPVSIEWAHASPEHTEIVSAVHLVRPIPEWRSQIDDDQVSTAIRGVSLTELKAHGEEPAWIAERMNQVLRGRELFSHIPHDCDLLRQLFDAGDAQPEFEIHRLFAETLIADLAQVKHLSNAAFARLKHKAQLRTPIYWPSVALAQMYAVLWADVVDLA